MALLLKLLPSGHFSQRPDRSQTNQANTVCAATSAFRLTCHGEATVGIHDVGYQVWLADAATGVAKVRDRAIAKAKARILFCETFISFLFQGQGRAEQNRTSSVSSGAALGKPEQPWFKLDALML